jgi:hypothetical protein
MAATFIVMAFVAYRFGLAAQRAAEVEVVRQGHAAELLIRGRVKFRETGAGLALPLGIALVLAALATLNLAGNETARVTTWAFQSLLFVVGGYITAGQVFAVRFVESAFRKSGDEDLAQVDVKRLMEAATRAFPAWFRKVVVLRFGLVTIGSFALVILLALPSATSYFR